MENILTKDSAWINFLTNYTFPLFTIHCSLDVRQAGWENIFYEQINFISCIVNAILKSKSPTYNSRTSILVTPGGLEPSTN